MQSLNRLILKKENANNTPLVRNLLSKKKLLAKGNSGHAKIKTALIIEEEECAQLLAQGH